MAFGQDSSVDPTLTDYLTRPNTRAPGGGTNLNQPMSYGTDNQYYAGTGMRPGGFGSNGPINREPPPEGPPPPGEPPQQPQPKPPDPQAPTYDKNDLQGTWAKLTAATAAKPSQKDHAALNSVISQLKTIGFDVRPGPIDEYGRQDSMYIGNDFYRIIDSSDNWTLVKSDGWSAWGDDGSGSGGGGGGGTNTGAVDLTGAINSADMSKSPYAAQAQSFLDNLLARSNQSLKVNPQDPIVKAQTDAYAASGERQLRNYLSDQAERGGPGQNLEAVTRSANENLAQADASFTGQVLQQELTARRLEVYQALSLYGSTLSDQQKMMLQEELAKLDAALSQAQLQQRSYEFDASRQDKLAGF